MKNVENTTGRNNAPRRFDADLTKGPVSRHILRMTPPMMVAFFAMTVFNLTDTWFVSRLGTRPLAAMGFTFPIVMVLHSLAMGLGLGTSSCVSRAIGQGDHDKVQHLATYALLLTFLLLLVISVVAWVLVPGVVRMMGAAEETADLSILYIRILLVFAPVGILPMVGNNAIRATGDTFRPSLIMSVAAVVNVVLDPIFIFGLGPVPAMGVAGAALATGIARLFSCAWAIWLMHYRCRLLTARWTGLRELLRAWGAVLHVGVPSAATNVLMPVTMGLITRLIADFGETAVAATAAGQRIEHVAYLVPIAMGTVLMPIIGQNWGAGRMDRVRKAWKRTNIYAIIYSFLVVLVAIPTARPVASCFSRNPDVIELTTRYLWILLSGAVLMHSAINTGFAFNAIGKPLQASLLTIIRLPLLVFPLAWLGKALLNVTGIYCGMAAAYVVAGIIALFWFHRMLLSYEKRPR
jgi:putative MATE family efflux protein